MRCHASRLQCACYGRQHTMLEQRVMAPKAEEVSLLKDM